LVQLSNVDRPKVARPNVAHPNVARPNVAHPNVARPNVARPNVARPNVDRPNVDIIKAAECRPSSMSTFTMLSAGMSTTAGFQTLFITLVPTALC
jgi:hypothetical protein